MTLITFLCNRAWPGTDFLDLRRSLLGAKKIKTRLKIEKKINVKLKQFYEFLAFFPQKIEWGQIRNSGY